MEDEVTPLWKLAYRALPQQVLDDARFGFHPQSNFIYAVQLKHGRWQHTNKLQTNATYPEEIAQKQDI